MKYCHMPEPCQDCPFRRVGGIRLRSGRIVELAANAAGNFPCHKTVDNDSRDHTTERECAGAIIFAYQSGGTTQMLRISERLGAIDPALAAYEDSPHPDIFESVDEMLETADDKQKTRKRTTRKAARP